MATERPDERSEQTEDAPAEENAVEETPEDAATIDEQSEQSFPASDPPSY